MKSWAEKIKCLEAKQKCEFSPPGRPAYFASYIMIKNKVQNDLYNEVWSNFESINSTLVALSTVESHDTQQIATDCKNISFCYLQPTHPQPGNQKAFLGKQALRRGWGGKAPIPITRGESSEVNPGQKRPRHTKESHAIP